jgi:hypothetical protein
MVIEHLSLSSECGFHQFTMGLGKIKEEIKSA